MFRKNVRNSCLNGPTNGLNDSVHIFGGNSPSTEDVSVGEILCGQVTDWKLGKNNVGACFFDEFQLIENDLPFSVHDILIQWQDLGVCELLWLLFEPSIGESLLEGNTIDEKRIINRTTLNLLNTNQLVVQISLVKGQNSINNHLDEEV
ncbi:hypothetical protein WICPIJ_002831 [Wickerhamomyces pijperi]|uniref:Uncharacterized protein n=1 Tax=Wickerhamomyces pijperi TaxID=599730 RepID=A0A9P8Q8Y6_WICPI|nr:hypothetical protein WICPIJ_002831 [Wickerhamomyces pijperi]